MGSGSDLDGFSNLGRGQIPVVLKASREVYHPSSSRGYLGLTQFTHLHVISKDLLPAKK